MTDISAEMQINKLKELLEEHRVDCLQLKKEGTLSREGRGMLILIELIYGTLEISV